MSQYKVIPGFGVFSNKYYKDNYSYSEEYLFENHFTDEDIFFIDDEKNTLEDFVIKPLRTRFMFQGINIFLLFSPVKINK